MLFFFYYYWIIISNTYKCIKVCRLLITIIMKSILNKLKLLKEAVETNINNIFLPQNSDEKDSTLLETTHIIGNSLQHIIVIFWFISLIMWSLIQISYLSSFNAYNLFSYSQVFSDLILIITTISVSWILISITWVITIKYWNNIVWQRIWYILLMGFCRLFIYPLFNATNVSFIQLSFCLILWFWSGWLFIWLVFFKNKLFYKIVWRVFIFLIIIILLIFGLNTTFNDGVSLIAWFALFSIFCTLFASKLISSKGIIGIKEVFILLIGAIFLYMFAARGIIGFQSTQYQKIITIEWKNYKTHYFNDKWVLYRDIGKNGELAWGKYIIPLDNISSIKID